MIVGTYQEVKNFLYPDHIRNFSRPTDRCRSWQAIRCSQESSQTADKLSLLVVKTTPEAEIPVTVLPKARRCSSG